MGRAPVCSGGGEEGLRASFEGEEGGGGLRGRPVVLNSSSTTVFGACHLFVALFQGLNKSAEGEARNKTSVPS